MNTDIITSIQAAAASIDKLTRASVGDYWTIGDGFVKLVKAAEKAGEAAPSQRSIEGVAQSKISRGLSIRKQFNTAKQAMAAFDAFDGGLTAWIASFGPERTESDEPTFIDRVTRLVKGASIEDLDAAIKALQAAKKALEKAAKAAA